MDPANYAVGGELGFEGMDFYFAGRGGVLGDVSAGVLTAALVFFEPTAVAVSWERSAAVMTRREAAEAWASVFHAWATENFPESRDNWLEERQVAARTAAHTRGPARVLGDLRLPRPR